MYLSHSLSLSACVCSVHTRYIQKYKSCAVPIRHQFLSALGKAIYFLFTCVYAFQSTGKCSFYWFRVSLEQIFSKWFYFVRITSGEWNGEWGRYHEKRKRKKNQQQQQKELSPKLSNVLLMLNDVLWCVGVWKLVHHTCGISADACTHRIETYT